MKYPIGATQNPEMRIHRLRDDFGGQPPVTNTSLVQAIATGSQRRF